MINNPYKLLVVDIDGTLLDRNGNISPEDRQTLTKVRDLGIQVSLSTGRAVNASLHIIDRLGLDSHHIFFDGALISSPSLDKEVYVKPISQAVLKQMIECAHQLNLDLELHSATDYFVERETWSTDARRQFFDMKPTIVDFTNIPKERIIKGNLITRTPQEAAKAEEFRHQCGARLHFSLARTPAYPGVDFINLLAPGVSKGKALETLAPYLGVSLTEVIAVGDGTNDISLLTTAGLAIAMGNAPDEVKAIADHVTLDVDHSGLTVAINKFLP